MNELQKKEFEILWEFVAACDKLSLTYYLVCGSALGAVKYGGFIPWDDDVDVAMPREDYERFLKEAPALLPEHLFIQNYRTDPAFPKIFTKIRDNRTTYIEIDYQDLLIHHGVFIDVFPLDGYPVEETAIARFEKRKKKYLRLTSCSLRPLGSVKAKVLRLGLRLLGYHKKTAKYLAQYEDMIRGCAVVDVLCNYGNFRGSVDKTPREIYGTGVETQFEGMTIRVPDQFDTYLRAKYGDYSQDPPKDQQVGHHYYAAMNLNTPYDVFIKNRAK